MDPKSFALRLLLTIPALGSLPGGRAAPGGARPLYAVGAPAALPTGYGLGVVAVPPPPAGLPTTTTTDPACPVEVRAIVTGEDAADTFVVVGIGNESALLSKGQGIRSREGWVAISEISADRVVLRKGGEAFDCFLGSPAGDLPPAPREPAR